LCGGWKPDPLLPIPMGGVPLIPSHHTQPIFFEVCIPRGDGSTAIAGNYSGDVAVSIARSSAGTAGAATTVTVPISLEVWPIIIPEVNSSEAWPMVFSFTPDMKAQYKSWAPGSQIMRTWYSFQTAHRMPADYLYGGDFAENTYQPYQDADFRDPAEYPVLADSGAWGANLLDVSNCEKNCTIKPQACVCPWPEGQMMAATTKQMHDVTAALAAASDSPASKRILACSSTSTGGNCTKGLYVYGFDENPITMNETISRYFGAIKAQWPHVRTMSVLNWDIGGDSDKFVELMDSLHVDTWVNAIDSYMSAGIPANWSSNDISTRQPPFPTLREQQRRTWAALGDAKGLNRKYFWYWCAEPSAQFLGAQPTAWLNTWVERPSIQGRIMMWLAALHDIDGILYWATNYWARNCDVHQRPCEPMRRINQTMYTDYNPTTWPAPWGLAAGEGSFTYPGEDGPIATLRIKAIRDGIEDVELFRKAGVVVGGGGFLNAHHDLITQLVTNFTDYREDPVLLERLRREVARRLIARNMA
jgi:hypothetical protein